MNLSKFEEMMSHIIHFTGLERDALHIYAGLTIYLIVALLHKRQLKSKWAIGVVVIVVIAIELFSARHDLFSDGIWRVGASLHDIINTIFWPMIIWLSVRFRVWKG